MAAGLGFGAFIAAGGGAALSVRHNKKAYGIGLAAVATAAAAGKVLPLLQTQRPHNPPAPGPIALPRPKGCRARRV
ncbi:MAG: hypothetical protein EAY75_02075 [Bacteroidetes bacterium]|nr:MAG: hypothetical protein EAY75_02075 [Bacteroidota bacterium]